MARELSVSQHSKVIGRQVDPRGQCEGEGERVLGVRPAQVGVLLAVWCWVTYCAFQRWSLTWDVMRIHKIKIHKKPSTEQAIDRCWFSFHVQDEVTFIFSLLIVLSSKQSLVPSTEKFKMKQNSLKTEEHSNLNKTVQTLTLHKAGKMVFH